MRQRVTLRKALYALIAVPSLLAAFMAHAEETPFISIVSGLAPDDLLNVRAKPSPIGKTETRLANGASVRNLGCNDIDGHQWCKVVTDNPKASGWTPARYLIPVNPATVPDSDMATSADDPAVATKDAGPPPDATPPPVVDAAPAATQPPADLTARLGGESHAAVPEAPMKSAATTAMQDAYGLALAAQENAPTGEVPDAAPPVQDMAAAGDSGAATADAAPAGSLPVPTPRPEPAGAAAAVDTQTVAELPPAQPPALSTGGTVNIPCARYVGQPMTSCAAKVVHKGTDRADVTVTWPDGGTRVISFYSGLPAGSNARGDFRFTREGSLSMIRVGVSERFEITDAVAFGE